MTETCELHEEANLGLPEERDHDGNSTTKYVLTPWNLNQRKNVVRRRDGRMHGPKGLNTFGYVRYKRKLRV